MIELSETEINVVSGGYLSPYTWYWSDNVRGEMGSLSSQWSPRDLGKDHLTAYKMKQAREANPDSPTWYADLFGL
jgi:hypothetical protein